MTENRTERTDNVGLLAIMSAPSGGGPGSNTQGWAFPYWNQVYLDALLAALHEAPRDGVALLTAPAVAPTVAVSATAGYLPAGQTLEIVQTWVDEWGRETDAGAVGTVSTGTALVDPLVAPTLGAPSAAATGFDGGLLEVWYAWIDEATGETLPSPVASVSVPYRTGGLQSEVLVTLPVTPASVGAAGAYIYARHRSGNTILAAAITVDTETEVTLDGSWLNCYIGLPLANSTGANKAVDITGIADASGDATLTRFYVRQSGETWTAGDRRLEVGGVDEWDPATVAYPLLYSGASGEMAPGYPPPVTQILPIRQVDLTTEAMGLLDEQYVGTSVTRDAEICQLLGGPYVQSGLVVTATAPASSQLQSSEGWALAAANIWHVLADTQIRIAAGDATHPRIDLVCVDTSGVVQGSFGDALLKGTPAAVPEAPATPAGYVLLAEVAVGVGATTFAADKITDRRVVRSSVGGVSVYESGPKPTVDWTANLPTSGNVAGQLAIVMPVGSLNSAYDNAARLYVWNARLSAWKVLQPWLPSIGAADYQSPDPGMGYMQENTATGRYELHTQVSVSEQSTIPLAMYGYGGMGDFLGFLGMEAEDKTALDSFGEPYMGDGTIAFTWGTRRWYYWDAATSAWEILSGPDEDGTSDITCGGSTTANFTIDLPGPCLITQVAAAATSAGTIDYDLELFEDSGRTILAYKVEGVDSATYDDRIPLEWFGGTTCYGKITNNSGDAITDLDLTIKTRR
jgi:hypothetical protein